MKTLLLVRHAKSSWEYDLPDIERPLKSRGIRDAQLVGYELLKQKVFPDTVYCSPATRAKETCKIITKTIEYSYNLVEIVDNLYDFGGQNVVDFVKSLDNSEKKVLIFGHNHAFTAIANTFGDHYIDNLPTSGFVAINFDVDSWSEIKKGKTVLTIFPRDLK